MRRQLPGLNALRAFEAVARHRSFSRAADELGVTAAAVSHQVKTLEARLGLTLLQRTSRSVLATPAGESLRLAVGAALDGIVAALQRLKPETLARRLEVSSSPSFTSKWLVPRLERFTRSRPDAEVRIDVSSDLADLAGEGMDFAIRFGVGRYPGLIAERLFEESLFPVCSPRLLQGEPPLRRPEDLRRHTLLHYEWIAEGDSWPDWRSWLLAAGVEGIDTIRGLHFSQTTLALQAALEGQGVALGDSTLVADDLAAGRLVQPFALAIKGPPQFAYHLVYREATLERPLARAFRDWLVAEAAASRNRSKATPAP